MTMLAAVVAAGHMYLFQSPNQPTKALFLLPAEGESACGVGPVNFGPADNSWSAGSAGAGVSCEFRQSVNPGSLLPVWVDAPKAQPGVPLEVGWTLSGGRATGQGHKATLSPEEVEIAKASPSGLHASATKVKNSVRVEVRNAGPAPVLLGDAVAARSQPEDSCVGNGPQVVLQPGETLVDTRPGLLSPSMKVYAAAFTGPKQCRWVEIARK